MYIVSGADKHLDITFGLQVVDRGGSRNFYRGVLF